MNNLESTVTLLKNSLHNSEIQLNNPQHNVPVRNDTSSEHALKSIENRLSVFETQLMNSFTLQNQMIIQNQLNIQNQLTLFNTQAQLSLAQSQMQNLHGRHGNYPSNHVYPSMTPMYPGPAL